MAYQWVHQLGPEVSLMLLFHIMNRHGYKIDLVRSNHCIIEDMIHDDFLLFSSPKHSGGSRR